MPHPRLFCLIALTLGCTRLHAATVVQGFENGLAGVDRIGDVVIVDQNF